VDDIRQPPESFIPSYIWIDTVEKVKKFIEAIEIQGKHTIELLDMDHDAGDCGPPDYIKILDWLEETGRNYPIHIHSMNPVGVENMRRIIQRNGWKEIS
jgi:hypothetical protein